MGDEATWARAEKALADALDAEGFEGQWTLAPGEGAFYGPKIEFHVTDALGRTWQCGTVQVDFSMPRRFGLEYVGSDGDRHVPVMIHRAIVGSMERFVGILIEHHAGKFPFWLAPVQAKVLTITDDQNEYAGVGAGAPEGCRASGPKADLRGGDKLARRSATPPWSASPSCSSWGSGRRQRARLPSAGSRARISARWTSTHSSSWLTR